MAQYTVWVSGESVGGRVELQKGDSVYDARDLVNAILEGTTGENLELGVSIAGADPVAPQAEGAAAAAHPNVNPAAAGLVARLTAGKPAPTARDTRHAGATGAPIGTRRPSGGAARPQS